VVANNARNYAGTLMKSSFGKVSGNIDCLKKPFKATKRQTVFYVGLEGHVSTSIKQFVFFRFTKAYSRKNV